MSIPTLYGVMSPYTHRLFTLRIPVRTPTPRLAWTDSILLLMALSAQAIPFSISSRAMQGTLLPELLEGATLLPFARITGDHIQNRTLLAVCLLALAVIPTTH